MTSKRDVTEQNEDNQQLSTSSGPLDQVRDTVGGALATVREKSGEMIADTREKTYRAANETNRLFQEHPIAAVAAAAAAGAVIAIFLPKLVIASKVGATVGKAGQIAQRAARSPGARQAAELMFAGLAKTEKAALQNAAVEGARLLGARLKRRINPKPK